MGLISAADLIHTFVLPVSLDCHPVLVTLERMDRYLTPLHI